MKGGDRPDVACDAWRRWEGDVALQRSLGLGAHRMSIEWARLEPREGEIDRAAMDRYREMIGALRDAGIDPMVTLHHFTLPVWLAERGGVLLARGRRGFRVAEARGTQDFFGINYYSRDLVRFAPGRPQELFSSRRVPPGAALSDLGWEIYPAGLGHLVRTWSRRSGVPVHVTENGIADATDTKRRSFLVDHLTELGRAIADGVDVRGYFHGSLTDNFEWAEGYSPRFGLFEVDYATQERRARASAQLYAGIARARAV